MQFVASRHVVLRYNGDSSVPARGSFVTILELYHPELEGAKMSHYEH